MVKINSINIKKFSFHLLVSSIVVFLVFSWFEFRKEGSVTGHFNYGRLLFLPLISLFLFFWEKIKRTIDSKRLLFEVVGYILVLSTLLYFIAFKIIFAPFSFHVSISDTLFPFLFLFSVFFLIRIIINRQDCLIKLLGTDKDKASKRIKGIKIENVVIVLLFTAFAGIQLFQIINTGVGTDEGNALYAAKLILHENLSLYKDFWAREPGSVLLFLPFLEIIGTSLAKLRILVALTNLGAFFLIFLISRRYLNKTCQIISLIAGILLVNNTFNIFAGTFYQFWVFLSLLIIYLILLYQENKKSLKILILLSLIMGASVIFYKGFMIFWLIVPASLFVMFLKDNKEFLNKALAFLSVSILPLVFFHGYFSLQTDSSHIYRIITGDVFVPFLLMFSSLLFLRLLLIKLPSKFYLEKIQFKTIYFWAVAFTFSFSIFYLLFSKSAIDSFWSGFGLEAFYFLATILAISVFIFQGRKRTLLLILATIMLLLTNIFGFSDNGFFTRLSINQTQAAVALQTVYLFFLIKFALETKSSLDIKNNKLKILLISSLILYLGFFVGGYVMPARVLMILPIYPILFVFFLHAAAQNKKLAKVLIFIFTINLSALLFTNYLFACNKTSYTIYDLKNFESAVRYINAETDEDDLVFSGDTAILSEIRAKNATFFTSPWNFRERMEPHYFYPGIEKKYPPFSRQRKEEIFALLQENNPVFILGSDRLTFKTFFSPANHKSNEPLSNFLANNYKLVREFDNIEIYKLIQ
ncbi:MAG: hypothetical protein U5L10_04475 [Candidatus Moranbacteria bacterium]|nr:hypothetical protein [Candidatus Moranbacteria bacterium]